MMDRDPGSAREAHVPDAHDVGRLREMLECAAEGGRLAAAVDADDRRDERVGAVHAPRRCTPVRG